ncbi:unnamed protein product [Prorocentrum cordatum]|uniref:Uncharacterized protein n=1 Tax=Prorocentrum cordatum TaxID=2364126 RepID=A0ABN9QX48_9DINO|nr:unnamed protein product [Polarella glacialis]
MKEGRRGFHGRPHSYFLQRRHAGDTFNFFPQPEVGSATDARATVSSRAPGTPVFKLFDNPFLKRHRMKYSDEDSPCSHGLPKEDYQMMNGVVGDTREGSEQVTMSLAKLEDIENSGPPQRRLAALRRGAAMVRETVINLQFPMELADINYSRHGSSSCAVNLVPYAKSDYITVNVRKVAFTEVQHHLAEYGYRRSRSGSSTSGRRSRRSARTCPRRDCERSC